MSKSLNKFPKVKEKSAWRKDTIKITVTEEMELKAPESLFTPSYGTPANSNRTQKTMKKITIFNNNNNQIGTTSINNMSLGQYNMLQSDNIRSSINMEKMQTQEDLV